VQCKRIPTEKTKRPDFWIYPNGTPILCEIKQINENKKDKKVSKSIKVGQILIQGETPGKRLKDRIKEAVRQLRQLTKKEFSAITVLYSNLPSEIIDPLDPYHIKVAMFGLEQVTLSHGTNGKALISRGFGGGRQVTPTQNTTLSGVIVLRSTSTLHMELYHNPYATIPIDHGVFKSLGVAEYKIEEPSSSGWPDWEQI